MKNLAENHTQNPARSKAHYMRYRKSLMKFGQSKAFDICKARPISMLNSSHELTKETLPKGTLMNHTPDLPKISTLKSCLQLFMENGAPNERRLDGDWLDNWDLYYKQPYSFDFSQYKSCILEKKLQCAKKKRVVPQAPMKCVPDSNTLLTKRNFGQYFSY
jgi:hypothetical protein